MSRRGTAECGERAAGGTCRAGCGARRRSAGAPHHPHAGVPMPSHGKKVFLCSKTYSGREYLMISPRAKLWEPERRWQFLHSSTWCALQLGPAGKRLGVPKQALLSLQLTIIFCHTDAHQTYPQPCRTTSAGARAGGCRLCSPGLPTSGRCLGCGSLEEPSPLWRG